MRRTFAILTALLALCTAAGFAQPHRSEAAVRALLADREKLESMSRAMASLAVPDATDRIVAEVLDLIH